ncbi:hypothetical protein LZC95_26985 [Pendulispora brunnea]|uniref:Uncharacterized protein n=1 Tax=Pendulispora brunnea TaxID=2905690 RepID=A0ABZ2JUD7_9BACT
MTVREILEDARAFARSGDWTGAIARAKLALSSARAEDERNTCQLEFEHLQEGERAWRAEIEARRASYLKRELGVDRPIAKDRTVIEVPTMAAEPVATAQTSVGTPVPPAFVRP